ncbi:MAG: hypothetical protein ABW208_27585 [Pyrinomonadaceae bacterium]
MFYSRHPLLLTLIYAASLACGIAHPARQADGQGRPQNRAESIGAVRIKEQWEEKCRGLQPSKNTPGEKVDILLGLLREAPEEQSRAEFERVRGLEASYESLPEYDKTLIQAFVFMAARRGDKERLVYLLSGKCPRSVGVLPIELSLGIKDPDTILVFFDGYERATADDTKRMLLEVLGSVFNTLRLAHPDNAEFLEKSRQWYLANKTQVKVNSFYVPHSLSSRRAEFFIPKS